MKKNKLIIMLFAIAGLLVFSTIAFATPDAEIEYTETKINEVTWRYDYSFENLSDANELLFKVFLFFDGTVNTTGSPLPTGWVGSVWEGDNSTYYLHTMAMNSDDYIQPTDFTEGFSFTVDYQAGNIPFHAEFIDPAGNFIGIDGTTAAVIVPEPISSLLFLAGGTTLAARGWLRKKRVTV